MADLGQGIHQQVRRIAAILDILLRPGGINIIE
jgi:hypothetical protein